MIQLTQEHRQARIDTPLGEDVLLLQHFSGSEALSRDFEYTLVVLSGDPEIDGNKLVGKRISATYFDEDGRKRHFNGFVSRFEYTHQVEEPAKLTCYQITMVPWLWFLKHNKDCQIFQEMKAPDIIKEIFQERGFTDFRLQLTENYAEREYCVQYRETDFDFVSRLMEEEGIFYYHEHTKDKHTLVLADSPSGYFQIDEEEVRYTPIGRTHEKQLTSWRHVYEFRPGKMAQKDFNFKVPTDPLNTSKTSGIKFEESSKLEIYEYPGRYYEQDKGDRLTKVRLEEIESEHNHIVGSGFYLTFSPGGKFKIDKHSQSSNEGKSFALVEVYTEFNSNLGFEVSEDYDFKNEFRCIPAETLFRPPRVTVKPVVEGPQTAIVVTDGQEIVVDEHARVKVQFHWDRYGKMDINSSCWIRVSQHHSGAGGPTWGMIDIPRKNEEVIVSFLDGDPDRPIITGRVYNGDNMSPYPLKGAGDNAKHKKRRGNITKSYEASGYNEFSMDDSEGAEQIRLHAQYDMDQHVRNDSREHVVNNRHLIVDNDQYELVNKNKTLNIKGNQAEHIEGDMQLKIGGSEGGKLDVVVEKKMTELIGEDGYDFHLKGDRKVLIDKSDSLAVSGDQKEDISGNKYLKVGMNQEDKVGIKHAVDAGQEIHLKAGMKVIIEAGVQISLVGPGGFVDIGPAGVTIQGVMVKINSGGAAGSGSGASPKKPDKPKDAKDAEPTNPDEADVYRP